MNLSLVQHRLNQEERILLLSYLNNLLFGTDEQIYESEKQADSVLEKMEGYEIHMRILHYLDKYWAMGFLFEEVDGLLRPRPVGKDGMPIDLNGGYTTKRMSDFLRENRLVRKQRRSVRGAEKSELITIVENGMSAARLSASDLARAIGVTRQAMSLALTGRLGKTLVRAKHYLDGKLRQSPVTISPPSGDSSKSEIPNP